MTTNIDNRDRYLVICNPISNEGHLDSWHVLFIDLMYQAGWKIIAATSDPMGLQKKLNDFGIVDSDKVIVFGHSREQKSLTSNARDLWMRWNSFCHIRLTKSQSSLRNEKDKFFNRLSEQFVSTSILLTQSIVKRLHQAYKNITRKAHSVANSQSATHMKPDVFKEQIQQIASHYNGQILAVLNMYIDAYETDMSHWDNFHLSQDIPWMGLCITPSDKPNEGYYELSSYKGTCFLDESIYERYRTLMPHKHFAFLPDITETALPKQSSRLALDIKRIAKDRKIVFMGGSIGKQKNLAAWYKIISMLDQSKWYFVQIGRVNKNNLTVEDEKALNSTISNCPENLYIYPEYLSDERYFNEIISISDIVFAVYRDFFRSSNMISKAAFFEKPILVSKNCLMGDRVNFYSIGKAVSQDNVHEMIKGLYSLQLHPVLKNNFKRYCQDFSTKALQENLSKFVSDCLR